MKTLSQISEDLYQVETELLRGNVAFRNCWQDVCQARRDLEPYITSPAHDTRAEGVEQKEGTQP